MSPSIPERIASLETRTDHFELALERFTEASRLQTEQIAGLRVDIARQSTRIGIAMTAAAIIASAVINWALRSIE